MNQKTCLEACSLILFCVRVLLPVVVIGPALAPRARNGYNLDDFAPYEHELELVHNVAALAKDGEEVAKGEPFKTLIEVSTHPPSSESNPPIPGPRKKPLF